MCSSWEAQVGLHTVVNPQPTAAAANWALYSLE